MTVEYTWKSFGLGLLFSRYGGPFQVAVILPFCGLRLSFESRAAHQHVPMFSAIQIRDAVEKVRGQVDGGDDPASALYSLLCYLGIYLPSVLQKVGI